MDNFCELVAPTLKELFVEKVVGLILSGRLKVGEKLPSERELASSMKVSKTVVHSGIEQLENMGFVYTKPQSGVYVADYMITGNVETIKAMVKFGGDNLDNEIVSAILDIRLAIEGMAFRRLTERRSKQDVAELRRMIDEIGSYVADEDVEYKRLAHMFFLLHRNVCIMSKSAMLPLFMNAFYDVVIVFWEKYLRMNGPASAINRLAGYVDCIERGEGEAACRELEEGIKEYIDKINRQS